MKSKINKKYIKPKINKITIDNEICLVMMSGGNEQNAPGGPWGQQNKINHIGKNDPFRA